YSECWPGAAGRLHGRAGAMAGHLAMLARLDPDSSDQSRKSRGVSCLFMPCLLLLRHARTTGSWPRIPDARTAQADSASAAWLRNTDDETNGPIARGLARSSTPQSLGPRPSMPARFE